MEVTIKVPDITIPMDAVPVQYIEWGGLGAAALVALYLGWRVRERYLPSKKKPFVGKHKPAIRRLK